MQIASSGKNSPCRSCNARSPSERKTSGLEPWGLRRITSSASQRNNATLPTRRSARTRLCVGWGRRSAAFFLITSSITSSAVRANGSIVYTAPTAAIRFLFAFWPLPRRWLAAAGNAAALASSPTGWDPMPIHQGHPFAVGGHHQDRSLFGRIGRRPGGSGTARRRWPARG